MQMLICLLSHMWWLIFFVSRLVFYCCFYFVFTLCPGLQTKVQSLYNYNITYI